jgi:hypothetical protein
MIVVPRLIRFLFNDLLKLLLLFEASTFFFLCGLAKIAAYNAALVEEEAVNRKLK